MNVFYLFFSFLTFISSFRVVSHVTCKVGLPKQTRPNEGILFVNVELGTMGAPNFEPNRQSDLSVYLNRLIEKCIMESRCIDLESLCIVSEEKVCSIFMDSLWPITVVLRFSTRITAKQTTSHRPSTHYLVIDGNFQSLKRQYVHIRIITNYIHNLNFGV